MYLPVEGRFDNWAMLNEIEPVLSVWAGFAKVQRKGAITEDRVKGHSETHRVVAVSPHHLPGKLAAGTETAHVAF